MVNWKVYEVEAYVKMPQ